MARSINGYATFSAVIHSLHGGASLVSLNQRPLISAFVHQALLLRPMRSTTRQVELVPNVRPCCAAQCGSISQLASRPELWTTGGNPIRVYVAGKPGKQFYGRAN